MNSNLVERKRLPPYFKTKDKNYRKLEEKECYLVILLDMEASVQNPVKLVWLYLMIGNIIYRSKRCLTMRKTVSSDCNNT
jgi:hypothetical protein